MNKIIFIAILFSLPNIGFSQSVKGLTGKPDSSYTTYLAWLSTKKNYPGIRIAAELHTPGITEKKNITYCRLGKRTLQLDAFFPTETPSRKRIPILIIHGGGWRSGNRAQHYPLAQHLAAMGYVCFTPEYRLSTEALYPAGTEDIKSAIRWLKKNAGFYHIDTTKITVLGFSAGGEIAAFMGTTSANPDFEGKGCHKEESSIIQAVIDIDGTLSFVHPESGEGDDSKKTSAATYWFGYSKNENPELWRQASPLTHAGKNTPPTLFINSAVDRMHAGRDDYQTILQKNNIYTEVQSFKNAPHSFVLFEPWFDSTLTYIDRFLKKIFSAPAAAARIIKVAQDGTGDYTTVQAALNAIPLHNKARVIISIKNGIYKEKIFLDATKEYVSLEGEDKFNTILTFDDHTGKISMTGDTINTKTSWAFLCKADHFTARNICFQNNAGFTAGQAVAVESDGDKAVFSNCRFIGNQDVLFTNEPQSRQYFEHCYIEGSTDFIFGSATVWFEQCHIHSKKNSHVTAAATPYTKKYGYIFYDCVLTGDSSLHNVSLGRPWRPYAAVVYLHCYIGAHIKPEGWSNWNKTDYYKTARYREYRNTGPGAETAKRVYWCRQLTDDEAKTYTLKNVFDDWTPQVSSY